MKNIQKIANEILSAKRIDIPKFSSNEEFAKWLEKQPINIKFTGAIFNQETGEILLEKGQNFGKYEQYALPKLLRGEHIVRKEKLKKDPGIFTLKDFKKYYRVLNKGNGIFNVARIDLQPFEENDIDNLNDYLLTDLKHFPEDLGVEQYRYDNDDFKSGQKYYVIKPTGLNKKYVLKNFEDFYNVKSKPLKYWFEETDKNDDRYSEYDGDAEIPVKITKKDNSAFTKDDLDIIRIDLKQKNKTQDFFGGAEVKLFAQAETKVLDEENLMMSMVR